MARNRRTNLEAKKTSAKIPSEKSRTKKINGQVNRSVQQFRQYFLRRNRGIVQKDKLLQMPVVVLDRCSVPHKLLETMVSSGDDMKPYDKKINISNTNKMKTVRCVRSNKPSNSNVSQCIQSFKITAQLNKVNSRKIDAIPLPIESTVSMNNEHSKTTAKVTTPRKRRWCFRNYDFKEGILRSLCNVTSSNSIFRNAFLERKEEMSPRAGRALPGTRLSLSRTVSSSSLNTISISDVWPYRETSLNISDENQHCRLSKCCSSIKDRLSFNEYDCPSKDGFLVKSDSSGYHSEQKLSDNSPTSSTASSPKRRLSNDSMRDLTVTVNCKQKKSPKQSVQFKKRCDFKTPKLPIFKRPPTRIQPHAAINTVNPFARETIAQSVTLEDNSDAISLFAESICTNPEAEDNQQSSRGILKISVGNDTTNAGYRIGSDIVTSSSVLYASLLPKQNVAISEPAVPKEPLESFPLLNKIIANNDFSQTFDTRTSNNTNKISDWVASTSSPKWAANTNNILNSMKRLCNFYFRHKQCSWGDRCKFSHKLPNDFQNNLRELNEEQFNSVMKEILKYKYLFKESFEFILMYYKENNHQQDLVYLIEHILRLDFDKTPFIKAVIETLKDMGYTFVDAISEILWTHGTKTESLMDILLMIIVEEDDCLENNWHFIDKITKFRKDKLDYGVVSEIFQKCCNTDTPNREFCENIYKDLIIKSHIELRKIDRSLVIKYINLLYYFNFLQYAEHLKQNNGIKDHELTIRAPEIYNRINSGEFSKSDETASYTTTSESSSSSDSSNYEDAEERTKQAEQPPDLENQIKHQPSEVIEEARNFSSKHIDPEDNAALMEVEEEEEKGQRETEDEDSEGIEANNHEKSHFLQLDLSLQRNHNYTNSELDTYLNYVNRDLYSLTNCYTANESSIKKSNIVDKKDHKSVESEHSGSRSCLESPISSSNAESHKELSDVDIVKLVASINKNDLPAILSLMKNSADNNLCRSFTIHMVTAIKNLLPAKATQLIVAIFENLRTLVPQVFQIQSMKHTMKMLAFNILPFLDKRKEYEAATRIIDLFSKEMEEFIKTESIAHYEWLSSTKLRYIFIFKIFVRDKKLKEALKLLKNSNLALFQNAPADNDLEYKQRVLNEFIDTALQGDLQIARESVLYLMLNMDSLQNINLGKFLNQLLAKMLNSYSIYKYDLLGLIDNIVNGWFKHLKHSVMRGLLIHTFYDLPERKVLEFFYLCVEVGVYRIHDGFDNSIEIPRNLLPEEILLVLHIHFHKICKSNFPLHNIVISMEQQIESDEYTHLIHIFTNSLIENHEMLTRILNVFAKFDHFPSKDKINTTSGFITIPYEYLKHFFIPYRTSLPSITKFR